METLQSIYFLLQRLQNLEFLARDAHRYFRNKGHKMHHGLNFACGSSDATKMNFPFYYIAQFHWHLSAHEI